MVLLTMPEASQAEIMDHRHQATTTSRELPMARAGTANPKSRENISVVNASKFSRFRRIWIILPVSNSLVS
jgi:hypothetical protein